MTPKDKAKELVEKFVDDPFTSQVTTEGAKRCVEILCDEILSLHMINAMGRDEKYSEGEFWTQVKKELKKP